MESFRNVFTQHTMEHIRLSTPEVNSNLGHLERKYVHTMWHFTKHFTSQMAPGTIEVEWRGDSQASTLAFLLRCLQGLFLASLSQAKGSQGKSDRPLSRDTVWTRRHRGRGPGTHHPMPCQSPSPRGCLGVSLPCSLMSP